MSSDLLIGKIREKHCPCCVGLDTRPEYIPAPLVEETRTSMPGADVAALYAEAAYRFNVRVIDAVADLIPAIGLQCSHYDLYGPAGAETMRRTILYAREKGLYVILDGKRNDVGIVAEACADSLFGGVQLGEERYLPYPVDAVTVESYPGSDGIKPFLKYCDEHMIFVMTRSTGKNAYEIQELVAGDRALYRVIASRIERWGADSVGEYGYSSVGAVVVTTDAPFAR